MTLDVSKGKTLYANAGFFFYPIKMANKKTNLYCLLTGLLIFLTAPSFVPASPFEHYSPKITQHTLENGMQFIILEDRTAPVVSFHIHVKVGSANEKTGHTGISHLLEHLAFNGTKKIGTTDWYKEKQLMQKTDRAYENLLKAKLDGKDEACLQELYEKFSKLNRQAGAYALPNEFGRIMDMHGAVGPNAYCSSDMTAYWVELPSNKIELWAMLESDRLFNPVFRNFYEELEVVKEERRTRVENSPWGRLMEEFAGAAYRLHPYRNPIIGYDCDLENMTRQKVKDFYRQHYIPSNIVVAVAGDISPEKFIPLAEKYFGGVPSGKKTGRHIPQEPPADCEKRVVITMDSQPILLVGFRIPDIIHPDIPALDICSEILGGGRTSRLHKKLVTQDKTAVSAGAWCWAPQYPGIFYLWAVASKGAANSLLETSMYEELENLKSGGIGDSELSGAKARLRMRFLTSLKSRRTVAREIAWHEAVTGSWQNMFGYIDSLDRVEKKDIARVVNKYFLRGNRIAGMVEPLKKD